MTVRERVKYTLNALCNFHRQGDQPNIFLFATPRGGSTWVMEIISSQPGMKYYDEPFNIRRDNVKHAGLFPDYNVLMPEHTDESKITTYLNSLRAGAHGHLNPPPYRPGHRFFTDRIVFKIHELEHLIGRIATQCNGQIVYLLRHPVPTTQSRKQLPRLELFMESPYYDQVIGDAAKIREIKRIGRDGSHLQKGTVSWCYENVLPLRRPDFDGLFVAYEEMTLNPEPSCDLLLKYLHFQDRDAMLQAFNKASSNIAMSPKETQSMMADADARRRRQYLVSKWKSKVTPQDEAEVTAIMELFDLDVYNGTDILPHRRYLHFADTLSLVERAQPAPVLQ